MSLSFCLALFAICVGMFGTDGQSPDGSRGDRLDFASLLNRSPPQDFLSGFGTTRCLYSPTIDCSNKKAYRTIDGSCNHEKAPYIGKSNTPYIRVVPAAYVDGKSPKTHSYFGKELPASRNITLTYFVNEDQTTKKPLPDPSSTKFNNVLAVFARFIEHDLYNTKLLEVMACCPTSENTAGKCNNIELKPDDPFFSSFGRTCLPKAQMVPSPKLDCKEHVLQQVNLNTHYLDLSNIYGSSDTKANELREGKDGLLKVTLNGKDILLPKTDFKDCQTKDKCFLAGDSRVNNDPLLMTMYTIWVRLHNDIAKEIKEINQKYKDEDIYQQARKIVIAIYQHIVYNEFLPSINPDTKLKPTANTAMKEFAKPQIANYFSIAFSALADTMTQGEYIGDTDDKNVDVKVKLEHTWYKPDTLWKTNGVKILAEGMLKDKAGKYDRFMPKALYDQYLQLIYGQGTDKVSMNLQQSRENGINTYYVMAAYKLNNYNTHTYADITTFDPGNVDKLKSLYPYIYDIEFLPGLFGEKISSVTGPFMAEILEKQFENLRDGDKFFYHHKGNFETEKLTEIKKMTMAAVMCKHAAMKDAPKQAFHPEAAGTNDKQNCDVILQKAKILDICRWATASWSEWIETPCVGGIIIKTRHCLYGPQTECVCNGSPVMMKSCPPDIQHLISKEVKDEVEKEYFRFFDDQGHPRPGVHKNSQEVARNILNHVVPK